MTRTQAALAIALFVSGLAFAWWAVQHPSGAYRASEGTNFANDNFGALLVAAVLIAAGIGLVRPHWIWDRRRSRRR